MIQSAAPQHVHLVLDDDEAVALIDELLEHIKESPSIVAVEARRRFVHEDEGGFRSGFKAPQILHELSRWDSPPERVCRGWPRWR